MIGLVWGKSVVQYNTQTELYSGLIGDIKKAYYTELNVSGGKN